MHELSQVTSSQISGERILFQQNHLEILLLLRLLCPLSAHGPWTLSARFNNDIFTD